MKRWGWVLLLAIAPWGGLPIRAQRSSPYPYDVRPEVKPRGGGINPLVILNLIQLLRSTGGSAQRVDLSPELAEVRSRIARLYFNLAQQHLVLDEVPQACAALDNRYLAELEAYLQKRLEPLRPDSETCHADELQRISERTGSPTALVYPLLTPEKLELILVLPDSRRKGGGGPQRVRTLTGDSGAAKVQATIQSLRANLKDPTSQDYQTEARQLYDWLVRPLRPQLQAHNIETLVFVMDGDLRLIPLAALLDRQTFLIEQYAVATTTSLLLTDFTPPAPTPRILAMGLSEGVQGMPPLPAAAMEAQQVGRRGQVFLNQDFTADTLRSQRGAHNLVHLATHAQFGGNVENSFLLFWNERVKTAQLPSLDLKVDLLTLSACETALGQNLGLGGAAVQAGARGVLASLWAISDAGTTPLMLSFYEHLPRVRSKALALQQTQKAAIAGGVAPRKRYRGGTGPNRVLGERPHPQPAPSLLLVALCAGGQLVVAARAGFIMARWQMDRGQETMQIVLNLPDFLEIATFNERDWLRELAIALFQQERISVGHASRMADMEILDFLKLLAYRQVDVPSPPPAIAKNPKD
ncbi:MAG: CHAT domain-containing protein [Oscillatoriales cyanobacterium SM2_1_8]|nr:CHAT domain-containing protein [Oscillatoriales cyanobacterium SM2_1_8]